MTANVLFIVGYNRSGSTVLERFLASHAGTVAIGEGYQIWKKGFGDRLCSCRRRLDDCRFWTAVRSRAFPPDGTPDESAWSALNWSVNRYRYVPMMHGRQLRTRRFEQGLAVSRPLVEGLYEAIADAASGRLVIDSSKDPAYAHLLSVLPGVRVAYLHLVRDPRAVGYSQQRVREKPEFESQNEMMEQRGTTRAALRWDAWFLFAVGLIPFVREPILRLRYEDFASDPVGTVARINGHLSRLGMPTLGSRGADADPDWYHSVSGNPMRFNGELRIAPDEEWRTSMPRRAKALTTILTAPFLAAHRLRIGFD